MEKEQKMVNNQKPIVVDLGIVRKQGLNESFLSMFGGAVEMIMKRMFGGSYVPVKIRGTKREVGTFIDSLKYEKNYMKSVQKYGLDDPRTFENKYKLQGAIKSFEKETGLIWPFK